MIIYLYIYMYNYIYLCFFLCFSPSLPSIYIYISLSQLERDNNQNEVGHMCLELVSLWLPDHSFCICGHPASFIEFILRASLACAALCVEEFISLGGVEFSGSEALGASIGHSWGSQCRRCGRCHRRWLGLCWSGRGRLSIHGIVQIRRLVLRRLGRHSCGGRRGNRRSRWGSAARRGTHNTHHLLGPGWNSLPWQIQSFDHSRGELGKLKAPTCSNISV